MAEKKNSQKPSTSKSKPPIDDFDDDFESLQTTFPPIYNFDADGDSLTFVPRGTSEGPNGTLILCELVANKGGTFKLKEDEMDVKRGEQFSLGASSVLVGDNKLCTATELGKLTDISKFCDENNMPVRLIFHGEERSKKNKMFRYKVIEIQLKKGVIDALK